MFRPLSCGGRVARFPYLPLFIALLAMIGGCTPSALHPPAVALPATEAPQSRPSPAPTDGTIATPLTAATPLTTASPTPSVLTLTWWTSEFLSPSAVQPVGGELAGQLGAFEASTGGRVRVDTVLKARYGKGGLLDYLLTSRQVAPAVLPDVIALDVAELRRAAEAGLLQPLDGLLSQEQTAGLYPFALQNGMFGERLLAVQWMADFEHLSSRPNQVPTPPAQWSLVLADKTPYLFALGAPQSGSSQAASDGLTDAALSHYLSAGAQIDPSDRSLSLGAVPLTRLLEFYRSADQAGLLPPNALELTDGEAVWSVFAQGQLPMGLVSGRRYLVEGNDAGSPAFSDGPGWTQPAPPVASGWALAIITRDEARQQAAASLISWLLQNERAASLSSAAGWFPTSSGALAMNQSTPYLEFVDRQLSAASSLPASSDYPQVAARIQGAILAVVQDDQSVDAAVQSALSSQK